MVKFEIGDVVAPGITMTRYKLSDDRTYESDGILLTSDRLILQARINGDDGWTAFALDGSIVYITPFQLNFIRRL